MPEGPHPVVAPEPQPAARQVGVPPPSPGAGEHAALAPPLSRLRHSATPLTPREVLGLQRTLGNRATRRLLDASRRGPPAEAVQRITYAEARSQLPAELTDEGKGGGGAVLDRWLAARGAGTGSHWDVFLKPFTLERLSEALQAYQARLATEEQMGDGAPPLPITDLDALLATSPRIGKYITARQETGARVGDAVRVLGDAEFQKAYTDDNWAAYQAGRLKLPELDAVRGKASPSALRTLMNFTIARSIDRVVGFASLADRTVYIRKSDLTSHTAIHEAIHVYGDDGFAQRFGKDLNEGATEALARSVLTDLGLPTEPHYEDEVNLIFDVMEACGVSGDDLKAAYFLGAGLDEVEARIVAKLGAQNFATVVAGAGGQAAAKSRLLQSLTST